MGLAGRVERFSGSGKGYSMKEFGKTIAKAAAEGRKWALISVLLALPSIARAQSTPFSGTPYAIPGTVCAANYDKGGEGVAYHDTDTANQGGAYRLTEGVDVEPVTNDPNLGTDAGCNFDVGYITAGEWDNYTVNIGTAGSFTFTAKVAALAQGGTFHLEMPPGTKIGGAVSIPSTTDWQKWVSVTETVTLPAGRQILRIVYDTNGPTLNGFAGNLHYFAFAANAPPPPPPPSGTGSAQICGTNPSGAAACLDLTKPLTTKFVSSTGAVITGTVPPTGGLTITPQNPTIAVGAQLQFKATDAGGNDVTGSVMWASSDPTIATITAGGLATGVSNGTVTITTQ